MKKMNEKKLIEILFKHGLKLIDVIKPPYIFLPEQGKNWQEPIQQKFYTILDDEIILEYTILFNGHIYECKISYTTLLLNSEEVIYYSDDHAGSDYTEYTYRVQFKNFNIAIISDNFFHNLK